MRAYLAAGIAVLALATCAPSSPAAPPAVDAPQPAAAVAAPAPVRVTEAAPSPRAPDGARPHGGSARWVRTAELPAEAHRTLALIRAGGPFPYRQDGAVFGNRERALPPRPRGYYREYTVRTPGARDRGARRIVAGRDGDLWYTGDHYRTFRRIEE